MNIFTDTGARWWLPRKRTPGVKWIFWQLALFILAILATYSRRSGPISIPANEARLSPLEFVRTLVLFMNRRMQRRLRWTSLTTGFATG